MTNGKAYQKIPAVGAELSMVVDGYEVTATVTAVRRAQAVPPTCPTCRWEERCRASSLEFCTGWMGKVGSNA